MVGRKQLIEFVCPVCDAGFGALPERAGQETTCNFCHTSFPIPAGLQPKLVSVGTGSSQPLTPEEETVVRKHLSARRQPEGGRQLAVPEVIVDDFDSEELEEHSPVKPGPVARRDTGHRGIVPITMEMPGGWGKFQAPVSQGTANSLAKTFLGGLLVAIGVFLAAMLGIKKRS